MLHAAVLDRWEDARRLAGPQLPISTRITEATLRDRKPKVPSPARCSCHHGPDASICPHEGKEAPTDSLLWALEARAWQGRDGGPSGPSSFLEFWPCCCGYGGLRPTPPPSQVSPSPKNIMFSAGQHDVRHTGPESSCTGLLPPRRAQDPWGGRR